jgi:hypothetical protein
MRFKGFLVVALSMSAPTATTSNENDGAFLQLMPETQRERSLVDDAAGAATGEALKESARKTRLLLHNCHLIERRRSCGDLLISRPREPYQQSSATL